MASGLGGIWQINLKFYTMLTVDQPTDIAPASPGTNAIVTRTDTHNLLPPISLSSIQTEFKNALVYGDECHQSRGSGYQERQNIDAIMKRPMIKAGMIALDFPPDGLERGRYLVRRVAEDILPSSSRMRTICGSSVHDNIRDHCVRARPLRERERERE